MLADFTVRQENSEQEVHETRYRKKRTKRRTKRHAAHTGKASSAGFGG
jgi:hypothetical protein